MSGSRASVTKLMRFDDCAGKLVGEFSARKPKRTRSLLFSIFGDAIAPHGGTVWLGSLINALEAFGINHRLVRTSVFRLSDEGWLSSEHIGRRSYYRLTEMGRRQFQIAGARIYSEPRHDWPGTWKLVHLAGIDVAQRDEARRRLSWLGFAPFSADLMAHPSPDNSVISDELQQLDGFEQMLVMNAEVEKSGQGHLRKIVHKAWALDELASNYKEFLDRFRPAYRAARMEKQLDPRCAFQVRTLLIHEYRKILLRDPSMPDELLPAHWDGVSAFQLCRNLYGLLVGPTTSFLKENMESADGPLPPAEPSFYRRFDGLPKQSRKKRK